MPRCGKAHRLGLGVALFSLLLAATPSVNAQASGQASRGSEIELLGSVGFGVSQRGGALALAGRETLSASYWPSPFLGAGVEGGGFANFNSENDNVGCGSGQPCVYADPRNRSGWFLLPRIFVGTQSSFVHWFAAVGIGYAHEDIPVDPPESYGSWMASLEAGADLELGPLSIVPSVCADAMDGGAALYPKLGVGLNF
jgi:hypothetical protein